MDPISLRSPPELAALRARIENAPAARSVIVRKNGNIWFLALTALGIVYGDIGTSPLYTFSVALNATGHAVPTASDVLGIVSLTPAAAPSHRRAVNDPLCLFVR
jgi:hypothetical protein